MNFDTVVIAGGLPLGVFVSGVLSFLKGRFGLSGEQARNVVAFCGLVYAIGVGIAKAPAASLFDFVSWIDALTNCIASGVSLIFGSEGFYQWVQAMERKSAQHLYIPTMNEFVPTVFDNDKDKEEEKHIVIRKKTKN